MIGCTFLLFLVQNSWPPEKWVECQCLLWATYNFLCMCDYIAVDEIRRVVTELWQALIVQYNSIISFPKGTHTTLSRERRWKSLYPRKGRWKVEIDTEAELMPRKQLRRQLRTGDPFPSPYLNLNNRYTYLQPFHNPSLFPSLPLHLLSPTTNPLPYPFSPFSHLPLPLLFFPIIYMIDEHLAHCQLRYNPRGLRETPCCQSSVC